MSADRAILRESARIRACAQDCRSRITRLTALAAMLRRGIRRALREEPIRAGEVRVSGLDSGVVAAWLTGVLLATGAMLVAAIVAHVVAAVGL